jgi:SagB-type dehydrogenase family enzyme
MSTVSVTVNKSADALMLAEWLKNVRFVQEVNVQIDNPSKGNAKEIKRVLASIKSKLTLANITDPVAYNNYRMKKWFLCLIIMGLSCAIHSQELQVIKLNEPVKKGGSTVMEAFDNRKSVREFSTRQLEKQDLADLLWATIGLNRAKQGLRTAPSWRNYQEIDVYACTREGAYLYNHKTHVLEPVIKGDFYSLLATNGQQFVEDAPIILLLVADFDKMRSNDTSPQMVIAALDAGIVSQNISLFCAGKNMATVPRGFMDKEELKKALKLKESQHIMLNHPVGYPK